MYIVVKNYVVVCNEQAITVRVVLDHLGVHYNKINASNIADELNNNYGNCHGDDSYGKFCTTYGKTPYSYVYLRD